MNYPYEFSINVPFYHQITNDEADTPHQFPKPKMVNHSIGQGFETHQVRGWDHNTLRSLHNTTMPKRFFDALKSKKHKVVK